MKIAILLLNRGRGSGGVAKEHAGYLLSQGHEVVFIHPMVGDGVEGAVNLDVDLGGKTLPVHEYLPVAGNSQKAVSTMEYDEAMAYVPHYEAALETHIDSIDIIIGHHANLTAIATANVAHRHNKPYALFLHGTGIEPRHHGGYNDDVWATIQDAVEKANGIIVTTEYVRDELVKNVIDLPNDRFIIQPCGVDLDEFNPANKGDIKAKYELPEHYVICPGALSIAKGPQNVVEASKSYADLAPTIFIGGGDLREELEEKLGERGRFLGFVSNEDKAQLINAATVLVAAPEKKEHFGIIYIEAMSGSVPVVAYEGGGVHSVLSEETGILTERNPEALGTSIRSVLEDEAKRASMAEAGRKRAVELFAVDYLGGKLYAWLEGLHSAHYAQAPTA